MATARVERRLSAILAADVVGYSRLMERDEAGTLARLKAHRGELVDPLVAGHRGRVVKLMGDGALCRIRQRRGCGRVRGGDPGRHGRAGNRPARGRARPLPRRDQPRRRDRRGRGHLRRRSERRRPARAAGRARRDRGLRHRLRPPPRRARPRVRAAWRAAPQEHRTAGQGLPDDPRRRQRSGRRSGPRCRCPTGPRSRRCRSRT